METETDVSKTRRTALLVLLLCLALTGSARAAGKGSGTETGVRIKVSALVESDSDPEFGLAGDRESLYLDLKPWFRSTLAPHWTFYTRGQLFASTSTTRLDSEEGNIVSDGFVGLRQVWVDYDGLTPYPGESLRVGLQRLRTDDGLFLDTDIEALAWRFDTTLLDANLFAAQRFAGWRTDSWHLEDEERGRLDLYGDLAWQWRPGHWLGGFLMYQKDRDALPGTGEVIDAESRRTRRDFLWFGLRADSDGRNRAGAGGYWLTLMGLTGSREDLRTEGTVATGSTRQDVNAWAADLGVSWALPLPLPVRVGAAWAMAGGGGEQGTGRLFAASGLGSNRSRFAGSRSRIYRFGDFLRPEFSNLQVSTLFATIQPDERYEGVILFEDVRLDDPDGPYSSDLMAGSVVPGSGNIGQELDICLTRYLDTMQWRSIKGRGYLRLRSSMLLAGAAYGDDEDSLLYRVTLDFFLDF